MNGRRGEGGGIANTEPLGIGAQEGRNKRGENSEGGRGR